MSNATTVATPSKTEQAESMFRDFITFAGDAIDSANATRVWVEIGRRFVEVANFQRESLADPAHWKKSDYDNLFNRVNIELKIARGVENTDLDYYIRAYAFIESVKDAVPNALDISYFQLRNKFLPMSRWDVAELSGSLKREWINACQTLLRRQLSDKPMTIKELDAEIAAERLKIEGGPKDKDATKETTRKRNAAKKKITDIIEKTIEDGDMDKPALAEHVKSIAKENGLDLSIPDPNPKIDPVKATVEDCKDFARILYNSGKLVEMVALRKTLDRMIASLESQNAEVDATPVEKAA